MHAKDSHDFALHFLGVGGSQSAELGSAAAVVEKDGDPILLIDCGYDTPERFADDYGRLPEAVFITHLHLDHVAGLEPLFSRLAGAAGAAPLTRLYVPAAIVPSLDARLSGPVPLRAEEKWNFWDLYQLIPVGGGFWHRGLRFDVFESRHHAPGFAHGLRLAGRFLYTGDTRPIPEVLRHYGNTGETLFHDCTAVGNPSHSGWDEISDAYDADLLERLVAYHYGTTENGRAMERAGAKIARPGQRFALGTATGDA